MARSPLPPPKYQRKNPPTRASDASPMVVIACKKKVTLSRAPARPLVSRHHHGTHRTMFFFGPLSLCALLVFSCTCCCFFPPPPTQMALAMQAATPCGNRACAIGRVPARVRESASATDNRAPPPPLSVQRQKESRKGKNVRKKKRKKKKRRCDRALLSVVANKRVSLSFCLSVFLACWVALFFCIVIPFLRGAARPYKSTAKRRHNNTRAQRREPGGALKKRERETSDLRV
nr:hypothetical protein [Pandoravirus massiliensis]